jgi:SAM-dependent methyltransferase
MQQATNNTRVSAFEYTGDDVLDVMAKYAVNRNKTVENLIRQHFNLQNTPIAPFNLCGFGEGRGEFIDRFQFETNVVTFATDLDPVYQSRLGERHRAYPDIAALPESMHGIFAIDVLEHIEDDRLMLQELHCALATGGRLLIYVPARMELYSAFDKAIGHFRRYTLAELKEKATTAGFEIETIQYHDFLGYFAAYYNKLFTSDTNAGLNAKAVAIYDKFLIPMTNFLEKMMFNRPFIGKNVLLVAKKIK